MKLHRILLSALGLCVLLDVGLTSWFRVAEHQEALVLTMGRASRQVDKGIHGKLPWPLETVIKRPVRLTHQLTFGYREEDGKTVLVPEEALMITGDENVVWADLLVEFKISDIKKFEFASENPVGLLRDATSAALRSVIGATELEPAITTGKAQIQAEVQDRLIDLMNTYDVGLEVVSVKLQDVEPPDELAADFKAVTDAREGRQTKVNEAEKYRNETIPKARGEAQQLIEEATAKKAQRINDAKGDVAKFNAILDAYEANPSITEQRLILETLDAILPDADIVIMDSSEGTVKYLPIIPASQKGGQ